MYRDIKMGSKSTPLRLEKKPKRQDSVKDRISELPDAILCHILSFIPTKYAVRTSILSTRWKRIWASVPILDFEYKALSVLCPWTEGYKSESYALFLTFVDRVLSSRDPLDIQKFRLHCYCSDEDFSRWIRTVIRHNVVELDLHVEINNDEGGLILELPQCVFMCKTLEVLKMKSNCIAYAPPTSGCFPSLKFLHVSVDYPDCDSMEKIFSCCPVLECLTIDGLLGFNDVLNFNISVPQLKTLRLEFNLSCFDQNGKHTFFINCPKLESLDIKQDILSNYSFENVKSLVKANVNLWCHYVRHERAFSNGATALLALFSNVKYLTLSAHFLAGGSLPAFDNLSELKLVLHDCYHWDLLTELLKRSPNLEYLVVEHKEDRSCFKDYIMHENYLKYVLYSEHRWRKPESVPVCLISHLKTITIRGYKGYPHEKKVAKYLLKKGQVLSKMTICNGLSKDFAMSRRASKACQLEFI